MCGQFVSISADELRDICKSADRNTSADEMTLMKKEGEIRPTDTVPVITAPEMFRPMQWGFTQTGKKQRVINARSETIMERPMFHQAALRRRCLIPCNGFFEWDKQGRKFLYHSLGRGVMYLAGLWQEDSGVRRPTFTILTRDAVGDMLEIHDRMPIIVPPELIDTWLLQPSKIAEVLQMAVTEIGIEPVGDHQLSFF